MTPLLIARGDINSAKGLKVKGEGKRREEKRREEKKEEYNTQIGLT